MNIVKLCKPCIWHLSVLLFLLCMENTTAKETVEVDNETFRPRISREYSYSCVRQDSLMGWAGNSVNAVIFRNNSLATHEDTQFMAYYNSEGYMCIAKRTLGDEYWCVKQTPYKGNVKDAHNCISIMVDGAGYLHLSWDHHDSKLNYTKSKAPLSLELEEKQPMTGSLEDRITYPGFYKAATGDLFFLYREGQSGKGNLVLNAYSLQTKKWVQVQNNLIDGEGQRSAYWQACVDNKGVIHLSWIWRETPDVATNHDMCYARSADGGKTWTDSKGKRYNLPVTANTAEYAVRIPQNSELINQTSITTDKNGHPYIATYYRMPDSRIPQYHVIYLNERDEWKDISLNFRKAPFSLSGGGTKKIPISRPQIVCDDTSWLLIFRDEERGSKVSLAKCTDLSENQWQLKDLTDYSVGDWEPTYDTELWKHRNTLHLFVQRVEQVDAEGQSNLDAQTISVVDATEKNHH